jgi:hypothetical protein
MGIATEELKAIVAQTQEWTQKLAKQRIQQAQRSTEDVGLDAKEEQAADSEEQQPVKAVVGDAATLEDRMESSKVSPSPQNTHDGSSSLEPERTSDKQAEPSQPLDHEAHPAAPASPRAVPDEPPVVVDGSTSVGELSSVGKTDDEPIPPTGEESATKAVDDAPSALDTDLPSETVASIHSAAENTPPSARVPVESLDKDVVSHSEVA